jgi:hypothetical protein
MVMFDTEREPPHVHVSKSKGRTPRSAKIWLHNLTVADEGDFTKQELNLALKVAHQHQLTLINQFNLAKAGKKVKTINLDK